MQAEYAWRRVRRRRRRSADEPEEGARPLRETEAERIATELLETAHSAPEVARRLEAVQGSQKSDILQVLQARQGNAFVSQVLESEQEERTAPQPPALDPALLSVGLELFLGGQWAAQSKRQEPLHLTPEIVTQLRLWFPGLEEEALRKLWDPEPQTPLEVLARLSKPGWLPPTPPEPGPQKLRRLFTSPGALPGGGAGVLANAPALLGMPAVGLFASLNAVPPTPTLQTVAAALRGRGLRLTPRLIQTLVDSRDQGIGQLRAGLAEVLPADLRDEASDLAEWLGHLLLSQSLEARLQGEEPVEADRLVLSEAPPPPAETGMELAGTLVDLARQLPPGLPLTIHLA